MNLRSRSDRDNGNQTAGQRRAAAELERIKREQAREPDREELMPPSSMKNSVSPRQSISSIVTNEVGILDKLNLYGSQARENPLNNK